MKIFYSVFFLSLFYLSSFSQREQVKFSSPLDIDMILSANFGELRANHFHSGLDFKTQGVINKNIYSIDDGYVSRIGINAAGYGLVLYITHPNGYTSVYAHLENFAPRIEKYVREQQYNREQYAININDIPPNILPVNKDEFIAFSGNTGSSGGPHLHFEIRETESEKVIDPLLFYHKSIKDNVAPEIRGIAIYAIDSVNAPYNNALYLEGEKLTKNASITNAWGNTAFGIYALDRMTDTHNIYGVKKIELFCDNDKIFSYNLDIVSFETSKMINSLVDYDYWKKNKRFFIKSVIEPGNMLEVYDKKLPGFVNINEEGKIYNLKYVLTDFHNNVSTHSFKLKGVPKANNENALKADSFHMTWNKNNKYITNEIAVLVPSKALYRDINFSISSTPNANFYSNVFQINEFYEPLQRGALLIVHLLNDTLQNKDNYGLVSIDSRGKKAWLGGNYANGKLSANISELGRTVAVYADSTAPVITPVGTAQWVSNKKIAIKLTDDCSGIAEFKGTIDGEFVLFQHDVKSPIYSYTFDSERLTRGEHLLKFEAWDNAGNNNSYEYKFVY